MGNMNSVDWNGRMEWWSGLLEWSTGLDYWRGVASLWHEHAFCGHCASCARKIDITLSTSYSVTSLFIMIMNSEFKVRVDHKIIISLRIGKISIVLHAGSPISRQCLQSTYRVYTLRRLSSVPVHAQDMPTQSCLYEKRPLPKNSIMQKVLFLDLKRL